MKAMLVPVGGMPRMVELYGLDGLQDAVGGYIEPCSWLFDNKPAVYCNEEGKFSQMPNRAVYARKEDEDLVKADGTPVREGDLIEIVFGDFVCVGFDPKTGEDRDISEEEAAIVMERFGSEESIESGFAEVAAIRRGSR